jgi:hypothetical protein
MDSDFRTTKYFRYLIDKAEVLDSERITFNKAILLLLSSKTDELGTVLKCHLIIEHYIDEYLTAAYPAVTKLKSVRLTFNQKIELINDPRTIGGLAYAAIKCLNLLRNKFSHKLAHRIEESDYIQIHELMSAWNSAAGKRVPAGLQLIQEFTVWLCGSLYAMQQGILRETPKLGLSGYLAWLEKMTKESSATGIDTSTSSSDS